MTANTAAVRDGLNSNNNKSIRYATYAPLVYMYAIKSTLPKSPY
jgi:hypothetical protein